MDEEPVILTFTLLPARFELSRRKYQMKPEEFANSLKKQGVRITADMDWSPEDKAEIGLVLRGGDPVQIFTGSFSVYVTQVAPVLAALAAWFAARNGRKVRLKIGDIEAEARTAKEVEKLLLCAKEFQQNAAPHSVTSNQATDES